MNMMVRQIVGGLIGSEIQRSQGGGGIKGALIGGLAMRVLGRMGPMGMIIGGAWAASQMLKRSKSTPTQGKQLPPVGTRPHGATSPVTITPRDPR